MDAPPAAVGAVAPPLLAARDLAVATRGVVFYATPHRGSPIASLHTSAGDLLVRSSPIIRRLRHDDPQALALNEAFAMLVEDPALVRDRGGGAIRVLSLAEELPESVMGVSIVVVPEESANPGVGSFKVVPGTRHVNVCKPASRSDPRYEWVLDFVAGCCSSGASGSLDS